jgi:tetratricopeptide (TPR) repeat protein
VENKYLRSFAAAAVLCFGGSIRGQVPEADPVNGEVQVSSPASVRVEVALTSLHSGMKFAEVAVGADGSFEFRHVPYGDYRLTVSDAGDRPIREELITIHDRQQPIQVRVTLPQTPKPAAGMVSAEELLHPPTKKAFQAVQAAQKLSEAGEHEKAAGQLEKAVRLSPDYAAAWINLAVQHIFLKRYEQALRELAHAGEISKPTSIVLGDMAYAQFALHRYAEGALSAREALRIDPSSAPAHYLLGSFLVHDRRTRAEGIQHLEVAARTMPAAKADLERARRESAQVVTRP